MRGGKEGGRGRMERGRARGWEGERGRSGRARGQGGREKEERGENGGGEKRNQEGKRMGRGREKARRIKQNHSPFRLCTIGKGLMDPLGELKTLLHCFLNTHIRQNPCP